MNQSVDAAPVPQAKPVDQVGFTSAVVLFSGLTTIPAGLSDGATISCPDGSFAIGGGYQIFGAPTTTVYINRPTTNPTPRGWAVAVENKLSATDASLKVYVVCVS